MAMSVGQLVGEMVHHYWMDWFMTTYRHSHQPQLSFVLSADMQMIAHQTENQNKLCAQLQPHRAANMGVDP